MAACLVLNPLTVLELPLAQTGILERISGLYLGGEMCCSFGWWEQMFARACYLGQSNLQLVPALTPRLPRRAVCKEEGPWLPKEKGGTGSWAINQHKQAPSRSLWPELCLMTSAMIHLSRSQSLLAGAGSVFPCTHDKGMLS